MDTLHTIIEMANGCLAMQNWIRTQAELENIRLFETDDEDQGNIYFLIKNEKKIRIDSIQFEFLKQFIKEKEPNVVHNFKENVKLEFDVFIDEVENCEGDNE